ncbi:hypothetical protein [Serratia sp. (in: enterobacteria)]
MTPPDPALWFAFSTTPPHLSLLNWPIRIAHGKPSASQTVAGF